MCHTFEFEGFSMYSMVDLYPVMLKSYSRVNSFPGTHVDLHDLQLVLLSLKNNSISH